jgi:predicted HTH transcriptional regulator
VKLKFEEIQGKTMAVIRVQPGPEPAFVKNKEFYVRSGNQSRKLETADAVRYIGRRW